MIFFYLGDEQWTIRTLSLSENYPVKKRTDIICEAMSVTTDQKEGCYKEFNFRLIIIIIIKSPMTTFIQPRKVFPLLGYLSKS